MSNYSVLKQDINNNIYENQTQQITGTVLNAILNEMTASLGAGYQFAGVATLGMNPGDPDQRVFYLAGEGIYTNFGGLQVPQGKLGVLKWDFRWTLQTIDGLGGGGANLTGYVSLASTDDLPEEGQPTLGYLCGTNLYLYVGTGGDTKEGKYQNCGSFRGPQGLQGDPGVGIASVTQTTTSTEDEGINVITVTKEDGTQSTFQVRNGSKGSQGIQGPQGVQGEPGRLQAQYKEVETLPTASADTMDFIYLVESQTPSVYDMYYTEENQGTYSWKGLGTTAVQLSDYATKAEVNQLEAKVDEVGGFYETNPDWIRAITDSDGRILFGIKTDGTIEWGIGVPTPVQEYVRALLTAKVDKVTGKSLIDSVIADMQSVESNPEFVHAITDAESKILEATRADGTKVFTSGVELSNLLETRGQNEQEWIKVLLDGEGKVIFGIKTNGELWWADGVPQCVKDYVNEQKEDASNFPYRRYFPLMQSLKRNKINRSTGVPYTTYNTLSLAVLSDIHSETDSLKRFLSFVTKYANFIDDSIILGDVVANQWNDYVTAWDSLIGYNRVLQVIGNHDVYNPDNEATDSGHRYDDQEYWASESRCRARYMAGISTWGVVSPDGASYYYKDYPAANVRLIVIDALHWNTAQENWFANVLYGENNADSAIALGRQVVVASHIAAGTQESDFGFFDCNFTGKDGTMTDWWENHDWREHVDIFQTTKGGTFICYLYGHTHTDFVGNYTDYPNQTFIIFPTGSPSRYFADTVSSKDSEFIDQFTIFSVEPESKMIRLFRIGANYSRHLVHRESIMIRYENGHREVVSQY